MSSVDFPATQAAWAFRSSFNGRWMRFLRESSITANEAKKHFGVDESTFRGWVKGVTGPSGFVVAIAFRDYGAAALILLGGWCFIQ